ncbi:protein GVQW3 [Trichonephila clavipes]|nr:protein GVQW3 [Trichonephila clavipes]
MERFLEQRYTIKFCLKLGKTCKETHDMIKEAYDVATMGRSDVFGWHKLCREGKERVEDDDRSGRPSTSNTNQNAVFLVEALTRLLKRIVHVCPAIANNWRLHHENAPSHTAFRLVEYLSQCNVVILPHTAPTCPARPFSVPKTKIDAQGEVSQIGRGGSTDRDE